MKIEITNDSSTLGKQYISELGSFKEKGKTKEEAKTNLQNALKWYFDFTGDDNIIKQIPTAKRTLILQRSFTGYMLVISYQDDTEGLNTSISLLGRINHSQALNVLETYIHMYSN